MASKKDPMDFSSLFSGLDMSAFNPSALFEIQRKNVEALVEANQKAAENMRAIAEQEQAYLQDMVTAFSAAADTMKPTGDVAGASAKQMQLALLTLERGIENMRTLQDMMTKSKEDSLKIINKRIDDSIEEIRETLDKSGDKSGK
jgi:phasin family protein